MIERDEWTTDEFGASHRGVVGVLLADGTVPEPVYFDAASGPGGSSVSQWYVYDGHGTRPRAAALRAVCSCGWTGPHHALAWQQATEDPSDAEELVEVGDAQAGACERDWDAHTIDVAATAVPLPEPVTALLAQLETEIENLTRTSPVAAVRATRSLEVLAGRLGYWAAHDTRRDLPLPETAAALALTEDATRHLLARLGQWSPYL
ncbi:hypothetical protein [Streptomyces sp. NPDC089919]|uniref:hypothetical protein n=1 Tax=Streptomyces sp. NPDC089919 TaxID=3155188 RepID=UPI00342A6335